MSDRKLFRPNLSQFKRTKDFHQKNAPEKTQREVEAPKEGNGQNQQTSALQHNSFSQKHKQPPPEQTSHENYYYVKQINNKNNLIVVLNDGEEIRGWLEWYDKNCIKIHTSSEQNYLIFKHSIKYITKEKQG